MIKDRDYNRAKEILENAGSKSAEKSHKKHTQGKGSPDSHGYELLIEAEADFRAMNIALFPPEQLAQLPNGLTPAQTVALAKAKAEMGLK